MFYTVNELFVVETKNLISLIAEGRECAVSRAYEEIVIINDKDLSVIETRDFLPAFLLTFGVVICDFDAGGLLFFKNSFDVRVRKTIRRYKNGFLGALKEGAIEVLEVVT